MNRWIYVAILLGLAGCATTSENLPETVGDLTPQVTTVEQQQQHAAIDEEVLYLLMTAELAGQRNEYYLALNAYLQAAKLVDDPRIAERAVKIGLYLKDEKRTEEALNIWLAKDGKNLGARKFAVLLDIKNQDRKQALANIEILLMDDPAGFDTDLLEMLKLFEKEGRFQFVYDVLEELDKLHSQQVPVLYVQAVIASLLPNNSLAEEKITQVLKLQPDWNRAIIFQAQLAGRSGDLLKAREYLEKAVKQTPEDLQLRKLLIEVLLNTGGTDDAARFCQKILDEKPDDADALFSLSLINIQRNQYDKADGNLHKLLQFPDYAGKASFYLGKIEIDRRHPEKALVWFDKVSDKNYDYDAGVAAITVLMSQKRFDEIAGRIKRMETQFPEQKTKLALIKAESLTQVGQNQQAFDVLTEALVDVPDNRDVLYARSLIAERLDKLSVLEADLRHILDKNPEDVSALNAMGYTLVDKTNRYEEAEKYLNQALKLQPDEGVIIDSYGWLQFKRGNLSEALDYLRRAYAKDPEPEIAAHIAEVLWTLGNIKEAKEIYEHAYKKSPDDEFLLRFKKRFLVEESK